MPTPYLAKLFGLTSVQETELRAVLDEVAPLHPDDDTEQISESARTERIRTLNWRQQVFLGVLLFFRERRVLAIIGSILVPATIVWMLLRAIKQVM